MLGLTLATLFPLLAASLLAMAAGSAEESDAVLVQRFQRGDNAAFGVLVARYQDRIFSQCLRWMGDPRIAEEVAQDVFLAVFRALPRFRGESRFSTWIYRITVNHCKNRRQYRSRRKVDRHEPIEGNPRDDDAPARQIAHQGPGTDRKAQQSEAEVILQEALNSLDEAQRTIILLRDIQDLSYDEIADILDLPRGTVKSRLHRARAELARIVSRTLTKKDVFE
ncbi:MAG: sigma-70 family RNA polymerase sigma factor [Myxococcota bacterium]